ncbi:myosin-binding protein 7-like [Iris pallida]|uniref:Myosin-binding protein 7-like n=1 Tax=Iris pallida TaxID=29817 RepID=A0AAX6GZY5_IRIPA|nr:myosin-binding protein 7-like [Iris pallida]
MAEDEVSALKVALCNQLLVIKRLYTELEEEREASASGADEALSMILRLQKEKAEEKMEHRQYKKMAEAKMQHAEDSFAMLEQALLQKEFENSSLKYQLQAYKQKLLSIGVNADLNNIAIIDNRIFLKRSTSLERTSYHGNVRRQISMPSLNKLLSEMEIFSGDGSVIPSLQSIWREVGVYENQFDKKQKHHFSREDVIEECNSDSEQVQGADASVNKVQQTQNIKLTAASKCLSLNKESLKSITTAPQSYQEWAPDQSNLAEPTTLATSIETDVHWLKHRIQQVEADICDMKQEDLKKRKRETKLLREIHEQLDTVQSHQRNLLSSKHSPQHVAMFDFLTEGMLSFWI